MHHFPETQCPVSLNWRNMLILIFLIFWKQDLTLLTIFLKLYFLLAYLTVHCFCFSYYSSGLFLVLNLGSSLFSTNLLDIDVLQRFSPARKWWNQENWHISMLLHSILLFLYQDFAVSLLESRRSSWLKV